VRRVLSALSRTPCHQRCDSVGESDMTAIQDGGGGGARIREWDVMRRRGNHKKQSKRSRGLKDLETEGEEGFGGPVVRHSRLSEQDCTETYSDEKVRKLTSGAGMTGIIQGNQTQRRNQRPYSSVRRGGECFFRVRIKISVSR